jgi:hypothetical protein
MDPNKPLAFLAFDNSADFNYYVSVNISLIHHLIEKGYQVVPYQVSDHQKLRNKIKKIQETLAKKIALLIVTAHGGFNYCGNIFKLEEDNSLPLKEGAKIVLNSCSTAEKGLNSVAAKISKDNPGVIVYASASTVYTTTLLSYYMPSVKVEKDKIIFLKQNIDGRGLDENPNTFASRFITNSEGKTEMNLTS